MEHAAFTWTSVIPFLKGLPPHVSNAILVSLIVFIGIYIGARRVTKSLEEDNLIPDERLTLKNFAEIITEGVLKLLDDNMGPRGREFILIIGTLSVFILFSNLSGLVPGFSPPTDNLNTTAACAITVFFLTHYYGFREHGVKYVRQFMGPVLWLAPLMVPIELIGHFARPLSLSVRLFGNIMGDHLVTTIFFTLIPLIVPLPVMLLGIFVAFVQTLVFVLLSMAYFAGAIAHEELE